tara:strand:+ start:16337 stop:16537 length:201 start_codon:yes stop_codon:yes gene_type:complete
MKAKTEVREFISEKLYNQWIEHNKEQLKITKCGFVDGKYKLTFEEPEGFTWIFDGAHSRDKLPIYR